MPYDEQHGPEARAAEGAPAPRADAPTREADAPPREVPPSTERRTPEKSAAAPPRPPAPRRRRPLLLGVLLVAAIAAAIGGFWYWYATRNEESTDDAYTDGNAVTVAPQVSGQVVELAINDNQHVMPGQVLIKIDPRPFIAALEQARGQLEAAKGQRAAAEAALELARQVFPARLAAAQANRDAAQAVLFRAQTDLRRQQALPRRATTQQDIDQAIAAERQAAAQVEQAEAQVREAQPVPPNINQVEAQVKQLDGMVAQAQAQLDQAEINLGWTTVTAPQEGWVTKRNVDLGNYVSAGAAIMSLVTPQVWVTANFKETQLNRMRAGQKVKISVDAYPGLDLTGHVDSVQLGSGSKFTAFPPENATGNFVKIVQRVPVKIDIDSGLDPNLPLPLGISVEPTVTVK
jgi:membrane fusion protein (multidrug efflux system)